MELICCVQSYEWGKTGGKGLVASLAEANVNVSIEESKPYAEFWMGTHPNGPSIIKSCKTPLSLHIEENTLELGKHAIAEFGRKLPFLFKILSVNKALSIQVHPSKSEAERLHESKPEIYKDSNHKPELAIALTEFEALCSFRPYEEIQFYVRHVPEFQHVIDKRKMEAFLNCKGDNLEASQSAMKECFQSLMTSSPSAVKSAVDNLLARLDKSNWDIKKEYHHSLVLKLNNEFPGDVGILCVYWLNYLTLKPGQAIFLPANEPHAYLSGDCVECMANSDNVVRAGLTTKLRDVSTLCEMLSYKCYKPSDVTFAPVKENEFCTLFSPPVRDFSVVKVALPVNEEFRLPTRQSASIIVVTEGEGVTKSGIEFKLGSVFYLPACEEFTVESREPTVMYQAFCNVD